jgi:hypothetical protein
MKEGEGGLSFNFRLEPVMLGNDDDGEAVTTCLVEGVTDLTRVERKTRTGPSVPASLRLFMNVFDGVISEHGTDERPIADMPVVRCIGIEKLRTAFYARRGDETPEAKRQAFKRGLDQAMSRKDILATDQDGKALLWRA